ncbi:VWA domain-containing protein [Cytophagaceae bacterium DM2B3-1]|uniref:VWA domain-containing protein n=1 Tax=Xanthocytophaga flava TaxID=3048013 RepID=A0ABT7CS09_9BACT|nr:VWA domain-containing protein [Xanthocytophaga flavus]MDJ1471741.1 VWA domain-containing protein [Xanthocytophaga flavus]MDJ1496510.1 VWA domain-containing protein [Xanthocytophaga flavus]
MDRFQITTSASPWFIIVCLAVGAIYAFILYQKKPIWGAQLNWALAVCRFVVVSVLCFLLMGPLVRQFMRIYEKPSIVIAIDNSESIKLTGDSTALNQQLQQIKDLAGRLQKSNVDVEVQMLDKNTEATSLNSGQFTQAATNLSQLLNTVQSNYENRNLAGVVLFSDGIYNQGISPEYQPYNFPIYPIAVGDTVPRRDVNLKVLYFNKITYLGNKFPIVAEIHSNGYAGKVVNVNLKQNNKTLATKTVSFTKEREIQEITFYTEANVKGIQHFVVEISPLQGEFTLQNNVRDAYIEVIDGKEKILLVAATPHPDIKAIKSALEKNDNYDLDIVIAGQGSPKEPRYDVVILHQIPDNLGAGINIVKKFLDQKVPVWYILGSQINIQQFNNINNAVKVVARNFQTDQVFPSFNTNFSIFKFEESNAAVLQKMPPITVPFGDFHLMPNSDVILYQRVGSVVTNKPLWIVNTNSTQKTAVMLGEGLWEWRMEEYNLTENQVSVDELISKTVQYLSSKDDKRKLRVYPVTDEFLDTDPVVFEAEVYNDIYEKIYGQKIDLQLTNAEDKVSSYSFTTAEGNSRFELSSLPKGVYQYKASTTLKGKNEQVSGEFVVKDQQLEALNTTADHGLLRKLASQTKGQFYQANQINQLVQQLTTAPPPERVQSREETLEMINLKWLFFVLVLLATIEWGTRKYMGAY